MTPVELKTLAHQALDDMKGVDIKELDVSDKTTVTDWMIVVGGTSQRHVKSLANEVITRSKESGLRPLGTEGESEGDWILVDLGDVIVHVMTRETRDFYSLEKLWMMEPGERSQSDASDQSAQDEDDAAAS
jgi:ribosome-associated protein